MSALGDGPLKTLKREEQKLARIWQEAVKALNGSERSFLTCDGGLSGNPLLVERADRFQALRAAEQDASTKYAEARERTRKREQELPDQ